MTQRRLTNQRYVLRQRPTNAITADCFELIETPIPELQEGQFLVRNDYLSLEPGLAGAIRGGDYLVPTIPIGGMIRGYTIGRVERSRHPDFREGDYVRHQGCWQTWSVAEFNPALPPILNPIKVDLSEVPASNWLSVLGLSGFTAWIGTRLFGEPKAGETFVVSAAAGAVGSIAGQIAKQLGARVVGIAGGNEKCAMLREHFRFDAAVDYRDDLKEQLDTACANGVDVYFENVGGDIQQAIWPRMNQEGRIVICGQIAQYNVATPPPGPNLMWAAVRRLHIHGIMGLDHSAQWQRFVEEMSPWVRDDKVRHIEDIVDGIENTPNAYLDLLAGRNRGKQLMRFTH